MSITKDFEERRCITVPGYPTMFYWDDVGYLLRHARTLEAMLKKHEWADNSDGEYGRQCQECGNRVAFHGGHTPECALAKLLD
jgi:hypothetical protein